MIHIINTLRRQFLPPFFIAFAIIGLGSCQQNSADEIDHKEACSVLDRVDLQLNELHDQLVIKHNSHAQFVRNLKDSQVRWTQYRNSMVQVYMDKDIKVRDYSQDQKDCRCAKMAELTIRRIQELEMFLVDLDETDNCCW